MAKKCCSRRSDQTEFPMTDPPRVPIGFAIPEANGDWNPAAGLVGKTAQAATSCLFLVWPDIGWAGRVIRLQGTPVRKEGPSPILESGTWPIFRE